MTHADFLQKLGLTNRQIVAYLDLATNPESTVVDIHRRINIPRSTVYLDLDHLMEKGFVISKKLGKSTVFNISDPRVLKFTIKAEKQKINELSSSVTEFIDSIRKIRDSKTTTNSINVYKNQVGIKQLLWNILNSRAKLVVGFSPGQLEHVTDRAFAEKWRREFQVRKMHNKIIFNTPAPLTWSDVPDFLKKNVEAKSLDPKKIKFDRLILIYSDVLTIISLKTDQDQYGIELQDRLLVQSYMQMFDFIWEHVAEKIASP